MVRWSNIQQYGSNDLRHSSTSHSPRFLYSADHQETNTGAKPWNTIRQDTLNVSGLTCDIRDVVLTEKFIEMYDSSFWSKIAPKGLLATETDVVVRVRWIVPIAISNAQFVIVIVPRAATQHAGESTRHLARFSKDSSKSNTLFYKVERTSLFHPAIQARQAERGTSRCSHSDLPGLYDDKR